MLQASTHIEKSGRILIPAAFRSSLGLKPGDELVLLLDDELRVLKPEQAVSYAQSLVRKHIPKGRLLSDELIAERRESARSE